jgi:hypothetical protein
VAHRPNRKSWADVKARLESFDRKGLVSLIGDLYDANAANRRFLNSRLAPGDNSIEEYRRLVADAIYPDPLSRRQISVRDAGAAITEYKRSTGDTAGTIDLMLTFVEAGTEQAADLGYGDDGYFSALENKLEAIVTAFEELPANVKATARARLTRIRNRAKGIGWGYGDFVSDVVAALERRGKPRPRPATTPR